MSDLYTDDIRMAAKAALGESLWKHSRFATSHAVVHVDAVLDAVAPAIAARALREFATERVHHQTPARLIEDMLARAAEIERP